MTARILVIGGSGRTGGHVVRKLVERGTPVRVMSRHPGSHGLDGAEVQAGDVTEPADVRRAMADVGGVVIAVEAGGSRNYPEQVHFGGLQNVLDASRQTGPHVVLVTQIYITRAEGHPEMADVIRSRRRAEEALRASGIPYTIVRPSWLTNAPGGQRAIRLEQGDTGDGEVSREDVAEVCVAALSTPSARGRTFEVYNEPGEPPSDWQALFVALTPDGPAA